MLAVLLSLAAAPITVSVSGIAAAQGRVHVDICPESGFLKPDCPWSGEAPATDGTTIVTIADVPPGRYAATGYWDRNGNGRVDRNLLGIPTERLGFSNDVRIHFERPKFDAAAFEHGEVAQGIAFTVRSVP